MLDCCQNALKTWNLTGQRDPVIGHFQVTTKPKLIRVLLGILVEYFGDFNVYIRQHRFIFSSYHTCAWDFFYPGGSVLHKAKFWKGGVNFSGGNFRMLLHFRKTSEGGRSSWEVDFQKEDRPPPWTRMGVSKKGVPNRVSESIREAKYGENYKWQVFVKDANAISLERLWLHLRKKACQLFLLLFMWHFMEKIGPKQFRNCFSRSNLQSCFLNLVLVNH